MQFLNAIKNTVLRKVPEPTSRNNLREGLVSFTCDNCFQTIESNFGERYSCSECVEFDLCLTCYKDEKCYYDNMVSPGKNKHKLPNDYQPPHHRDTVAPLPHFMTHEKKNQYLMVFELQGKSVYESVKNSFEHFKERRCLGWRKKVAVDESHPYGLGEYEWITYGEFHKMTLDLANSFSYYVKQQNKIAIFMDNCLEWYTSDFAGLWCSLATVPLHHTSNYSNLYEILVNSESSIIVTSSQTIDTLLTLFSDQEKSNKLKEFVKLIVLKDSDPAVVSKGIPSSIAVKTFKELVENGGKVKPNYKFGPRKETDISCISYTSGSTGTPKGVVHLDKFFNNHLVKSYVKYPTTILSFATLAHSQRLSDWKYLYQGAKIGIYSGSYDSLFDDFKETRPHSVWSVPRFWNLLYTQFKSNLEDEVEKSSKTQFPEPYEEIKARVQLQFSNVFGDRLRTIVTGGAPTAPEVLDFMHKVFNGVNISNSYGLTEAIGIMVDGYISDEVQFRLDPVPEFGYSPQDKPYPRGELVVKTESMSSGYYKNDEQTASSFDNGWFKTGDVVELIGPRKIKIIDRKKNAFKLSNGEFVTPEPLENIYLESKLIEQIFIYGDINKQFLVAVVVPTKHLIDQLQGTNDSYDITSDQNARISVMNSIQEIAKERHLANYEIPKVVTLDTSKWSQDNQLITGSGKYSRNHLTKFYQDKIEQMYQSIENFQIELRKANNTSNILEAYLKSVLNVDSLDGINLDDISFSQMGGDSLGAVKLSKMLKDNDNIEISPSVLLNEKLNLHSLTKIVDRVNIHNHSQTSTNLNINSEISDLIKVNWDDEFTLDESVVPVAGLAEKKMISKDKDLNIFLTGCTGYLGVNLLHNLLEENFESISKIYCLVRKVKTYEEAKELILSQFIVHGLEISIERFEKLFVPVFGDLSKPNLSISDEVMNELVENVDMIIHNGANVNMVVPYPNMKPTNVDSTKTLLKLATLGSRGLKRFVYVSTIGVFISKLTPVINEYTEPSTDYMDYSTGYNQSKLVSDVLVREASKRGLPVMIFRPGTIYCHSKTGFDNQADFVGFIIKSIITSHVFPKLLSDQGGHFNLSPVDWVADSIVSITLHNENWTQPKQTPQIFHMVNEHSLHLHKLCEYIDDTVKLNSLTFSEWKQVQFHSEKKSPYLEPIRHLLESSNRFPGFENHTCPRTKSHLTSLGKSQCSRITKELVTKNINYLLNEINKS